MSAADRMMRNVLTLLAVVPWAWSVVVAELDRGQRVSLDDVEPPHDGPHVSVVVPARDEGRGVRAAIASLAAQEYRALEVIVVDDESSDATAAEARAAATHRVRVLEGKPMPTGWVGKSWACHRGTSSHRESGSCSQTLTCASPRIPSGVRSPWHRAGTSGVYRYFP